MSQDTNVENLIINKLTRAQYESITTPYPTQLYFITDEVISSSDVVNALGYTPYNATNPAGYISSAAISSLTDVALTGLADGQVLKYNSTTQKWENSAAGGGGTWGSITGTLSDQTDLQDALTAKQNAITSSAMLSSDLVDDTGHTHKFATATQLTQISTNTTDISTINSKIPSQASASNTLADKAFVNSTVQTATANFRGNWNTWANVPTSASSYPADYAGSTTPTVNDYLVVQDASDYTGDTLEGTWRFKYSGTWATDGKNGWLPEYQVNETPLTAEQLAALNSGITISSVALIGTALQPNANISLLNNNAGYITGIDSTMVVNALGYTPYNSSNPRGYITASALNGYATESFVTSQGYITASALPDTSLLSYYGTCATGASTQAKVVVCTGFTLKTGVSIRVKFTNAQSYNGQPTLNVNSTGAKNITLRGTTASMKSIWQAGEIVEFTYDGTNWIWERGGVSTTTYYGVTKLSSSLTSTSTALAATPSTINGAMQNIVTGYPVYSATATYEVGDRVRYSSYVWECTTAITEAEAWNAEHWTTVDTLQAQIDDITSNQVTSVNNIQPVNGNVSITIPTPTYDVTNERITW